MDKVINGKCFDQERALYNLTDASVIDCKFEGPADGESAFKEARRVKISDCLFALRYPLWHIDEFSVEKSMFTTTSRAPLWYAKNGIVKDTRITGVKALRECENIKLITSSADSAEFGWKCNSIRAEKCSITSEYVFFDSKNIVLNDIELKGKYSFQYIENLEINDSDLDTKDAFWHSRNVTVRNSRIKGEYLGWYSEGLTLINCTVIGTQPLCYAKKLRLIDCKMVDCDLAFEYSDVEADVIGKINSVKNPASGFITADSIGEVIHSDSIIDCKCRISIGEK